MNCESIHTAGHVMMGIKTDPKTRRPGKETKFRILVLKGHAVMSKGLIEAQYRESVKESRSSGSLGRLVRFIVWVAWDIQIPKYRIPLELGSCQP